METIPALMARELMFWLGLTVLGFAPYPGHVSARTTRAFWIAVSVLCLAFWVALVPVLGEWANIRAWGGFAAGVYVLLWRFYPGVIEGPDDDSADE